MLMSKRVAWLGVRVLILPLHHAAGVPSITLGSKEPQEPGFCWICCQRLWGLAGVFLPPRAEAWSTPLLWLVAARSEAFQAHQKLPSSHFCRAAGAAALVSFWPRQQRSCRSSCSHGTSTGTGWVLNCRC